MAYLFLFDIDHTLLTEKSIHRRAFHEAIFRVFGKRVSIDDVSHAGMTDQKIIIEVLKYHKIAEPIIYQKLATCKRMMCEIFSQEVSIDTIEIMPGVLCLLTEIKQRGYKTALVTGNLECIARKKMEISHLEEFFPVGGFGSDNMEKTELIKLAQNRASKYYQASFANHAVIIGDTMRDISAGKITGIKTVAVASGPVPYKELVKSQADLVLYSLTEYQKIFNLIERY